MVKQESTPSQIGENKRKETRIETLVKLGPVYNDGDGKTLCPMMREISSRKLHPDLAFNCSGGTVLAQRFFMAAQSKFLR